MKNAFKNFCAGLWFGAIAATASADVMNGQNVDTNKSPEAIAMACTMQQEKVKAQTEAALAQVKAKHELPQELQKYNIPSLNIASILHGEQKAPENALLAEIGNTPEVEPQTIQEKIAGQYNVDLKNIGLDVSGILNPIDLKVTTISNSVSINSFQTSRELLTYQQLTGTTLTGKDLLWTPTLAPSAPTGHILEKYNIPEYVHPIGKLNLGHITDSELLPSLTESQVQPGEELSQEDKNRWQDRLTNLAPETITKIVASLNLLIDKLNKAPETEVNVVFLQKAKRAVASLQILDNSTNLVLDPARINNDQDIILSLLSEVEKSDALENRYKIDLVNGLSLILRLGTAEQDAKVLAELNVNLKSIAPQEIETQIASAFGIDYKALANGDMQIAKIFSNGEKEFKPYLDSLAVDEDGYTSDDFTKKEYIEYWGLELASIVDGDGEVYEETTEFLAKVTPNMLSDFKGQGGDFDVMYKAALFDKLIAIEDNLQSESKVAQAKSEASIAKSEASIAKSQASIDESKAAQAQSKEAQTESKENQKNWKKANENIKDALNSLASIN